jgi:molybdenum cofactor guanylyltransferase
MDAIILAGGLSRRMKGTRKAFLRLGSETFIERLVRLLGPYCEAFSIVTNEPDLYARFDARIVCDEREGCGPLMGVYSGLKASTSEQSFITAVDTPLVEKDLVLHLSEARGGCDACVPRWNGMAEPLCAVYSRRCLPAIESVLDQGRIVAFFPLVRVRFVDESEVKRFDPLGRSFFNVNAFGSYDALCAMHAAD